MDREEFNLFLDSSYFFGQYSEKKFWYTTSHVRKYKNLDSNNPYPVFYSNDFFLNKKNPYIKGEIFREESFSNILSLLEEEESEKPFIKWNKTNKDFYLKQFNSLKTEIEKKHLLKGVPYTFQLGKAIINRKNKIHFLKKILNESKQKSSYIYGFWNNNFGFIGITPELLFLQKENKINTIALAGTIKNTSELSGKVEELLTDLKMNNEHKFVIDGIKTSLSKFGNIKVSSTYPLVLPNLVHLKTDIEVDIFNNNTFAYEEFLKELHPTAAVGILPKLNKNNWLENFETKNNKRNFFAAPFGIIFDELNSICVSTIRGIYWNNECLRIPAGGGVIAESNVREEWCEIQLKIETIKKNLGLH